MKLIVFGATGDVGRRIVSEALARGHGLTAVARSTASLAEMSGDVERVDADLLATPGIAATLSKGHDAVISALRPPAGQEPMLVELTRAVLEGAAASDVPIFVTGGAATLELGDGSGHTVLTAPGLLPDTVRPVAEACAAQKALLDASPHVRWHHLLPPAMLIDGPRRGVYAWGSETLVTDASGVSRISYADFAAAMLDLVESQPAPHGRATVGWATDAHGAR